VSSWVTGVEGSRLACDLGNLTSVRGSRSEFLLGIDHSLDTIIHVLDKVDFGAAESAEVRDIENTVVGLGVLTVSTTDLYVVLIGDGLELILLLGELGKFDMHGGAHTSSAVRWARGDVTQMLVVGESGLLLNFGSSSRKSLEDLTDVGALLHGDDTELVLFVDPDKECLGIVVEDSTSLGPLTLETTALEIFVTTLEEEMIGNKLFAVIITHISERVVFSLELTIELLEG